MNQKNSSSAITSFKEKISKIINKILLPNRHWDQAYCISMKMTWKKKGLENKVSKCHTQNVDQMMMKMFLLEQLIELLKKMPSNVYSK